MASRKPALRLLYSQTPPVRWFRAALASVDDGLAILCAKHWQGLQSAAIRPAADRAPACEPR